MAAIQFKANSFKEATQLIGQDRLLEFNKKFILRSIEEIIPPSTQAQYRPEVQHG